MSLELMDRPIRLSCVEGLNKAIFISAKDCVLVESMPLGLLKITSDGYLNFVLLIIGVNDVCESVKTRCQELISIHWVPLDCLYLVLMMI